MRLGRSGLAGWVAVALVSGATRGAAQTVGVLASFTAHQALFSVALDGKAGLAVGTAGAMLQSQDAGASWQPLAAPPQTLALLGVALRQGHAVAVGQRGTLLIRDESGHWRTGRSGSTERLFAVCLNNHGAGVAVGAFGTVLATPDWGATWHNIAPDWSGWAHDGEQPHLYDATIDDSGTMTIAGEFGLILRSPDGKTWNSLHQGEASIFALDLREDGGGYAVGQNGTVLRTADSGAHWQKLESGTKANLLGVRSTRDGKILASGMHDMLASDNDGRSWRRLADARFASAWYQGIADGGAGLGWLVVGHAGQLLSISK